jgi:hypothetical protein
MFAGRKLLIVTKHQKERVIAPILEAQLGVSCILNSDFDTDSLGTFSGEIERKGDALSTLREKCRLAAEHTSADLVVASEGSFGPHPSGFGIAADDELLLLTDRKNQLEIIARELSVETNFSGREISGESDLMAFAEKALFPSHALILKNDAKNFKTVYKGLTSRDALISAYRKIQSTFGKVYAETDMRAMHNPSRMKVIERACLQLTERMKSCCPQCQRPGFWVTAAIAGLPCELCRFPTRATLTHVYECSHCHAKTEKKFPHGKEFEDPMYCDLCNP